MPDLGGINPASPDTIKAMPPEDLFNYLGIRLNGEKAAGKKLTLNASSPISTRPTPSRMRTTRSITALSPSG